jgi:hypothetical protein
MSDDYRPRFSFEISEEQKTRADKLISVYGIRKSLFQIILDDVLDMIENHGEIVIGAILGEGAKPRQVIPSMAKTEKKMKSMEG